MCIKIHFKLIYELKLYLITINTYETAYACPLVYAIEFIESSWNIIP